MTKSNKIRSDISYKSDDTVQVIQRLDNTLQILRSEYLHTSTDPWVLAYSGGKDSTLLLQLTWEMLLSIPKHDRKRKIYVVGNDTLVESPLVIRHLRNTMKTIANVAATERLPIECQITKPHVDQTFWVNVIGRGYIPPTRNFRWCTDRMKILPTSQLLERLVRIHRRVVLMVGTRKSESTNRRRNMEKHGASASRMNPHSSVNDCYMFAPIAEFEDKDVWMILLQRNPPWGGTHRNLVTLYRNAGGGECPLVLTKEDAPSCGTTSPRFGCWTCTVVKKDRSLRGIIASGHDESHHFTRLFDFREWLVKLREDDTNRQRVRRDGNMKTRPDGSPVMGPFKIDVRERILRELKSLEHETGEEFITNSELEVIEDIWRRDRLRQDSRLALHNAFDLDS